MKQLISRKFEFDAGHRVMNEQFQCFNMHGHRYYGKIVFKYNNPDPIGYAIDFKEIKRVGLAWINKYLDHAFIANPMDEEVLSTLVKINSKTWMMSLNGSEYCNPTAENISKELFMTMELLFDEIYKPQGMNVFKVVLYETPNCSVVCKSDSITKSERKNFMKVNKDNILNFRDRLGILNYDDRNNEK